MMAVVTTGNGGYDRLEYREVPVPELGSGEVLLRVLAAGVNNTEINTRLGWYSATVSSSTEGVVDDSGVTAPPKPDGGWNDPTPFPLIQGTDCCGVVEAIAGDDGPLVGGRALIRPCMRPFGFDSVQTVWMGSDFDGAFAQYVKVPATDVFMVDTDWSDAALGSVPCAYGTAENMVDRAGVGPADHVLVTGASGGVGSAAVQLAKRRGATVTAVCGEAKMHAVKALGADRVVGRGIELVAAIGADSIDVAIDNVAGPGFPGVIEVLTPGGRYVSSGAIAGPMVTLDMRRLYLKDLTLIGCTAWDERVFPNLISYIERDEIRPVVAKTFALEEIATAQQEFLQKDHVGQFVLIPPPAAS
jgi:NADPH:quinone reductase-like Zn-dependent oxidoreductase